MEIKDGILSCICEGDIINGTLHIPEGVKTIGSAALFGCRSLTSITIPASVASIGNCAFEDCNCLTSVHITDLAAWCGISFSNAYANPLFYAHNLYINDVLATEITIPSSVTRIGSRAFYGCSSLTSVTFAENSQLTSIGDFAFCGCSSLTSIAIPQGVTNIGEYAFEDCTGLESTTFAENSQLTSIGSAALFGCRSLTSITIPNSVASIGNCAFWGCGSLLSVKNNYKAFHLTKRGRLYVGVSPYLRFNIGRKTKCHGELLCCRNGIHYCTNIFDIFNYYYGEYGKDFVITICDVSENNVDRAIPTEDSKRCAEWVKPTKILTREEVIKIMNGEEV